MRVLFVCFANVCRSPAAAALLARESEGRIEVVSRGLAGGPDTVPVPLEDALASRALSVTRPVGVALSSTDVSSADLCLFMERRLLREVVVAEPMSWPRAFTVREFARRALADPPHGDEHDPSSWIARLHAGRSSEDLLGADEDDDLLDPGLSADRADYFEMIDALAEAVTTVSPFLMSWLST